ncbi:MAG: ATP-binding cassette domain-containing protein [Verrucomicrobia bacterium]|nr:ATP-binding cassette domain-containing protein [Verrucomicrobiota bacterium]MBI3868620.1 ATP-binding cassette domain-containing protein [Verrucomicrobiota bacterium]
MPSPAPDSSEFAVELTDVECWGGASGREPSLTGIHWKVAAGEFWAVGGLMGSGKTSLLSSIAGLFPPARGSVKVLGTSWLDVSPEQLPAQRLKVGLVHGGGLLLRHLSVAENISLPLRYHHDAQHSDVLPKLGEWLAATGLESVAERPGGAVSRNWAQRAGLARACSLQPEILLVDNPLSGLDPQDVRWWVQFLGRVSEGHPLLGYRRLTVIVTCDDLPVWRAPGRRYATLAGGQFRVLDDASSLEGWATTHAGPV